MHSKLSNTNSNNSADLVIEQDRLNFSFDDIKQHISCPLWHLQSTSDLNIGLMRSTSGLSNVNQQILHRANISLPSLSLSLSRSIYE